MAAKQIQSRQRGTTCQKSQKSRVLTLTKTMPVSRGPRLGQINQKITMANTIYKVPSRVLFGLGVYDLIRGFMHTFALKWSGINIA